MGLLLASCRASLPNPPVSEWRITLVRAKGQYLGRVEAADEATAIEVAIEQFGITDREQQRRLIAQRISS